MPDPVQPSLALSMSAPPPPDGVLEGEVRRIVFENDDNGFRVLRVLPREGQAEVAVVGVFPRVVEGARIRATGSFVEDRRHGRQFKAETLLMVAPETLEGVRKYLGSGLIPGIGSALAQRIVDKFGEQTLQVLDSDPQRLREVSGLGVRRVQAIGEAWQEQRAVSAVMVFLQSHGVSPSLAIRIHKRFGKNAMNVVSHSPYRLALDVWGIGFKTADSIAQSVGIARDAPERAQAGVLQTLHDITSGGHCYTERADLVERAAHMLAIADERVDEAIDALAAVQRVSLERMSNGTIAVYLPALRDAEVSAAEQLAAMLTASTPLDAPERAVAEFERLSGLTLAPEQRDAVAQAARSNVMVITGGPGVGKTTLIRALLALMDVSRVPVRLAAPTGRAAKRMSEATGRESVTIHRLLEFEPKGGTFMRHAGRPLETGALIVDEMSMVSIDLASALFSALRADCRLIMVGDVDQLPSVGPGAVLRDVITSGTVPTVRLMHIFRQAEGSSIVESAHRIHRGEQPEGAQVKGEQFYILDRRDPASAAKLIRTLLVKRIPEGFGFDPVRDIQVLTPMHRGDAGATALNSMLQETLNPRGPEVRRGKQLLRLSDKVMQLRNNYDKNVFNGDLGRITEVDVEERTLTVQFDEERSVSYGESDLDELTLAYATSIHKSQGSEYPVVVVPVLTQHFVMLSRNLLYTAVTRGKQLVVMIADPRALSLALAEVRKEMRRTHLAKRLRQIAEMARAQ